MEGKQKLKQPTILLSANEAAAWTGYKPYAVRAWVSEGRIRMFGWEE